MSQEKRRPDRLTALERWQTSELEDAKVKMAQLNTLAAEKHADVARIEDDISNLHTLAREQAKDLSALDADALLRMNEFRALQQQQLQTARQSHEQATQQADDAQSDVLRLFENLSVVQRLLERRQELATQEELRQAQKQLDEGALSRAPQARLGSNGSEDQSHGS
jgi:hypothetical protein